MTHSTSQPPPAGAVRLTVAITGASGLIGSAIAKVFEQRGHTIRRVVRRAARDANEIAWSPDAATIDTAALEGVDAVIHLAGESLFQRWTDGVKQRIRESRVNGTALLSRALASLERKPSVLLSGSAIGIYGAHRDGSVDETSTPGDDFLAVVAQEWESATAPASAAGIRVVNLRTGLVLSPDGGLLGTLLLPFRLGAGGRLGAGEQWMSWIAMTDYLDAIAFLLDAEAIAGPVNLVAPNPVTNLEFTRLLARVLRRPAFFTVPRFAMAMAMGGEMADAMAFASQRVRPRRLLEEGFDFSLPTLEAALRAELGQSAPRAGTQSATRSAR